MLTINQICIESFNFHCCPSVNGGNFYVFFTIRFESWYDNSIGVK